MKADAQSSITFRAAVLGILLVLFVAPPGRQEVGSSGPGADWRPVAFAAALLVGLGLVFSLRAGAAWFEIQALTLPDAEVIAGMALLWALLLHLIWRFHAPQRLIGSP